MRIARSFGRSLFMAIIFLTAYWVTAQVFARTF
jgi:hypothetical protein